MTPSDVAALTLSLLAGLAAVISAATALVVALKTVPKITEVASILNGRLDQLIAEREARVRAEHAAELERARLASLIPRPGSARPDPIVREFPPGEARD